MKIEFAGKPFSLIVSADSYCPIVSVHAIQDVFESIDTAIVCQYACGEQIWP